MSAAVPAVVARPLLVVGLGNPWMGDDGIGWHLVERLGRDPRRPPEVETTLAGDDLLAAGAALAGRRGLLLVDAIEKLDDDRPRLLDPRAAGLDDRSPGAHALSAIGALRLLDAVEPGVAATPARLFAVPIDRARVGPRLSPGLERRLPELLAALLAACSGTPR